MFNPLTLLVGSECTFVGENVYGVFRLFERGRRCAHWKRAVKVGELEFGLSFSRIDKWIAVSFGLVSKVDGFGDLRIERSGHEMFVVYFAPRA